MKGGFEKMTQIYSHRIALGLLALRENKDNLAFGVELVSFCRYGGWWGAHDRKQVVLVVPE